MNETLSDRIIKLIRRIARVWSILSILALLVPFIVEGLGVLQANNLREAIGWICYVGLLVGLVLTWRWLGLGSIIAVASFVVFYAVMWITSGKAPRGPYFILIAAPGFLLLICWLTEHYRAKLRSAEKTV